MLTGLVSIAGAESTASTLPIKVELDFSKYPVSYTHLTLPTT